MIQPYDQIKQAEKTAEAETREQLKNKSLHKILDHARTFHSNYNNLIQQGFNQEAWVSYTYFIEMLEHAYPNADYQEKMKLATTIEELIVKRLGEPTTSVQQSDIIAAKSRRETAQQMVAEKFSEDQILELERQALLSISPDRFPENFEEYKEEWLAQWAAQRLIRLPDPSHDTASNLLRTSKDQNTSSPI